MIQKGGLLPQDKELLMMILIIFHRFTVRKCKTDKRIFWRGELKLEINDYRHSNLEMTVFMNFKSWKSDWGGWRCFSRLTGFWWTIRRFLGSHSFGWDRRTKGDLSIKIRWVKDVITRKLERLNTFICRRTSFPKAFDTNI